MILFSISVAFAQDNRIQAKQSLVDLGFEDVRISIENDTVFVSVEDCSYRGTFRGPAVALKTISGLLPDCSHYEMTVNEYGISKVGVHAEQVGGAWNVKVDYDVDAINKKLKNDDKSKSSYRKIDINLIPIVTLDNHTYDKLYEVGIFFAPSFESTLWKGNRLIVQPIIPLYTNFSSMNSHRNVRLGVAAISQELLDKGRWTAKVCGGSFYPDVVGLYGEVGYHLNPRLDLSIHAGYSYTSVFYDQKWYIGSPSMLNAMFKASYYEPSTSLQFEAQAGRFMYGDWGTRVDVTRHFGEYAIGLYGILTGGEHNGGFHFAIPFGGKRQKRSALIRVRAPEYYDMQYSMVSYWKYAWEKMGREFEEIPDKNHSAHYWQADYIERYMKKSLNGAFE